MTGGIKPRISSNPRPISLSHKYVCTQTKACEDALHELFRHEDLPRVIRLDEINVN